MPYEVQAVSVYAGVARQMMRQEYNRLFRTHGELNISVSAYSLQMNPRKTVLENI
jgi:hypothetical protein